MHFTRHGSYKDADVPVIVRGEGAYICDANGKRYLDALAGPVREPARPRPRRPRRGRRQAGRAAGVHAAVVLRAPQRHRARRAGRRLRARRLNRVFFTSGGGEAVETAWKLAKNYFKLTGKPMKHKVLSRTIAYHGTTQGALSITGLPGLKQQFEPLVPSTFRVPNTNFYRAPEHVADDLEGVRPLGRRPDRGTDRERGPRHRRRRLPRAGAERRRLLPAAARLLPAGPRDLRRVRRAAGLRRGHLRLRPAGPHVRLRALRLRARHDHLRQGHHLRLRPARRDDRQRQADGAVPGRRRDVRARLHLRRPPGLDRGRAGQPRRLREREDPRERPRQRGGVPRRPSSGSRTCRSSATSAATGSSTGSSWSRTRRPRRPSPTRSASGSSTASSPSSCTPRASTAAPTTAATRSSSSRRR